MRRLSEGLLSKGDNPKAEMPFLDHLEELRWRILWSLLAVIVCSGVALAIGYYVDLIGLLLGPGRELFGEDWSPIYLAPTGSFFLYLQISFTVGVLFAFPVIAYQVWGFFAPALEKHEKRAIIPALYMGLVLFVVGVALGYFIALPISLRFLVGFQIESLTPNYTATGYLGFVVQLLLAFGVVFELPVVVLVLSVLGLITPGFLRNKRRHAIIVILLLASIISPGDVIQITILLMIPLIALYEFSIFLCVMVWRRREGREQPADAAPPEDSVAAEDEAVATEPTPYDHGDPSRAETPEAPDGDA